MVPLNYQLKRNVRYEFFIAKVMQILFWWINLKRSKYRLVCESNKIGTCNRIERFLIKGYNKTNMECSSVVQHVNIFIAELAAFTNTRPDADSNAVFLLLSQKNDHNGQSKRNGFFGLNLASPLRFSCLKYLFFYIKNSNFFVSSINF